MFQFPAFASNPYVFRVRYLIINAWKPEPPKPSARFASDQRPAEQISQAFKVGFPIRRSMDQSLFAAPHGLSQRITSFIACACQGIHQMPLLHLIVLIADAHHLAAQRAAEPLTFYKRFVMMPSTCSIRSLYWNYAEQFTCARSLRPASRDQIRYRAVRQR